MENTVPDSRSTARVVVTSRLPAGALDALADVKVEQYDGDGCRTRSGTPTRRDVLGAAANRPAFRVAVTVAVTAVAAMSLLLLGQTLLALLGVT